MNPAHNTLSPLTWLGITFNKATLLSVEMEQAY